MKTKKEHSMNVLERYRSDIARCVKCGSCRAVCPPFLRERSESQSARGRMALVQAVLDGRIALTEIFRDRLATCTGCLACEAACPSSVPVTKIIQAAKEQAVSASGPGLIRGLVAGVLKHPAALRTTAWLAPVALHYYTKGPGSRGQGPGESRAHGQAARGGERSRGKVAFFPGCAVEYFQPEIKRATAAVLGALGYEMVVPAGWKCCGRPLLSLGDRRAAEALAAHNTRLFSALDADAIVTACASCSLTFKKEYRTVLTGSHQPAVLDIHEFLAVRMKELELGPVAKTATWHDPCHLGRGQGLSGAARGILRAVRGLQLEEMKNADQCCGFGGVMRLTHHRLSDGIAEAKAASIRATKASAVVTGCPGCRMQLSHALKQTGAEIEVLHTVQVLEAALRSSESKENRVKGQGARVLETLRK